MSLDPLDSVRGPDPTVRPAEVPAQGIYLDRGPALPAAYGRTCLVALVRDPRMIHFYWRLEDPGAQLPPAAVPMLRLLDLAAGSAREIPLLQGAREAYIEVAPDGSYAAEIGCREADGAFRPLLRSNEVRTPPAGPCVAVDPQWYVSPGEFARMLAFLEAGGPQRYERPQPKP